jgi:hypothetical protein
MACARRIRMVSLFCFFGGMNGVLSAGVIINTSLSLTNLQIQASAGTVDIQTGLNASAFASVEDSLGGSGAQYNSVTDAATSANASTPLVFGSGAASAPAFTESASSGVAMYGINASAGTNVAGPYGALQGFFEIVGTTGPVNVTMNATIDYNQTLVTDTLGVSAYSEVIFALNLPDTGLVPFLFYDSPLSIGSDATAANSGTQILTNSTTLQANTLYTIYAESDAESLGVDSAPEPASIELLGLGLSLIVAGRKFRSRQSRRG